MPTLAHLRSARLLACLMLLAGAAVLVLRSTVAQDPGDDSGLDAEIVAASRDVEGAKSPQERAAAQAKLDVLLHEKAEREAARASRPGTTEEDLAKSADAQDFAATAEAEAARRNPVLSSTDTGEILTGAPWNTNDKSFVASLWWQGPRATDGTRLAIWAGGSRTDKSNGAVLVYRFLDDGNGTIASQQSFQMPGHGHLRLVGEQSGKVEIEAADGTLFTFDTHSLSFR